ncbi:unnamed protein product [Alopecurus aequalis]
MPPIQPGILHPLHRSPASLVPFHGRLLHSTSTAVAAITQSIERHARPQATCRRPRCRRGSCRKRSRTSIESTDEYEEISCIGEGGFGVVLKALHRATGKIVAIKYLSPPDDTEKPPDVAELLQEARFLETCSGNPHVVGLEGLVRHPTTGELRLVMEYVAAPTLHRFLWGRPLTESMVRTFMWKLLTGAKMMHDRHVVHRDIKPKNILVGQGGEHIKFCDLGLPFPSPSFRLTPRPTHWTTWRPRCCCRSRTTTRRSTPGRLDAVSWPSTRCSCHRPWYFDNCFLAIDEDEFIDEVLKLDAIFRVLGTPDEKTWPGFTSLPLTAKAMPMLPARHKDNRLREFFPEEKLSEQGFEVLQGLLTCNPDKRLTAAKALKLPWFALHRPAAAAKLDAPVYLLRKKAPRIPRAIPEKITFKIPLAVWNAQRM